MKPEDSDKRFATAGFSKDVKERSDVLIKYFLLFYFSAGIVFAFFYDTWAIALGVGSLSLIAYFSVKKALPDSDLYQYVLSAVLGVFMAQFIYQMHGLFEMHFFAFIGSAILITYQNWKLQIPMLFFVIVHHLIFWYMQNSGVEHVYFTQLDTFEPPAFIIHILLSAVIFFICGLWSYQLKKYSEKSIYQTVEVMKLQKVAHLSDQLKQSERRFSALIQKGADLIAIMDENTICKYISPSVQEYLGYDSDFLLNKSSRDFIHPDDVERTLNALKLVYTQKEITLPPARFRHANGEWRWFEIISTNMLDNSAVAGIVINARDITERRQQELEREQIIMELTKSNADLHQFSYITSHNLRSPLCNIDGILSIMDYTSLTANNRQLMEMLHTSTRQLSTTINDLTDILLIKNNTNIDKNEVKVQEIYDYAYNVFKDAIKEINGSIETHFSVDCLHINKSYIESIFINLISNAIKYHSPDRKLHLAISVTNDNQSTRLTFADNGLGINVVRHKERLFGLYQRFHTNASGTGLGLFIIKEQVVALGGDISLNSQPGIGSTFTITLPCKTQQKAIASATKA